MLAWASLGHQERPGLKFVHMPLRQSLHMSGADSAETQQICVTVWSCHLHCSSRQSMDKVVDSGFRGSLPLVPGGASTSV